MNTLDLSRYSFLQPKIAAILVWVSFIYGYAFPVTFDSIVGYANITPEGYLLAQSLFPSLFYLYITLVLWKILQVQFRFHQADTTFLLIVIKSIGVLVFLFFPEMFRSFDLPEFAFLIGRNIGLVLEIFLLSQIAQLPEDLFGQKRSFIWLGILLAGIPLSYEVGRYILPHVFKYDVSSALYLAYIGSLLILGVMYVIIRYRIFRRAQLNPHTPSPSPAELLIEELGEEDELD